MKIHAGDRLALRSWSPKTLRGATIHPELAIVAEGTPAHSIQFRDAAVTPRADEVTLLSAALVAQTAYELFADPALVAAAWDEFRGG